MKECMHTGLGGVVNSDSKVSLRANLRSPALCLSDRYSTRIVLCCNVHSYGLVEFWSYTSLFAATTISVTRVKRCPGCPSLVTVLSVGFRAYNTMGTGRPLLLLHRSWCCVERHLENYGKHTWLRKSIGRSHLLSSTHVITSRVLAFALFPWKSTKVKWSKGFLLALSEECSPTVKGFL